MNNGFKKIFAITLSLLLVSSILFVSGTSTANANSGFYVSGTTLYDANGNPFVMRGINHGHAWYKDQATTAIEGIANTGANTVRIVLSDGGQWTKDDIQTVRNLISLAEDNNLVAVLEVHDATGYDSIASLNRAVDYWIEMRSALIGKEDTVIINIANEWFGSWDGAAWADGYKQAIPRLRNAGLNNTLMIDAAGWGQFPQSIHDYGREVFNADPERNTMFSIHMYEYAGGNASQVRTNIDRVLDQDLALVIGEFGHRHTNGDVDEATIMSYSEQRGVGWLAWSWKGNGPEWEYLDLSNDWAGNNLTAWGNTIVNGPYGLRETSRLSTVFTGGGSDGRTSPTTLYDFEESTQGWTGSSLSGGPWTVTEWSSKGNHSLKADIQMSSNSQHYLHVIQNRSLQQNSRIQATVKHANWGSVGNGMTGRLYVKTGHGYTWYSGSFVPINGSSGTTLSLDLSNVQNLSQVREIGVQFQSESNSSGQTSIYIDNVIVE